MTASELTSELDRLREMARHEDSHSGAMIFESKARILVENEFDLILKSLRFAADMENLVSAGEDPVFVRGHNCIWIDGSSVAEQGDDIYAAARKAVEALEGKQ